MYYGISYQMGWAAGEMVSFAATGGTIPPFTVTLTAPTTATLDSPATSDGGVLFLSRTNDLTVAWTSTSQTVVVALEIESPANPSNDLHVVCEYAGAAGSGVVPASVMGLFDPSARQVSFGVGGEAVADFSAGTYPIHAFLANSTVQLVDIQ
jgi:hypothetical protein